MTDRIVSLTVEERELLREAISWGAHFLNRALLHDPRHPYAPNWRRRLSDLRGVYRKVFDRDEIPETLGPGPGIPVKIGAPTGVEKA